MQKYQMVDTKSDHPQISVDEWDESQSNGGKNVQASPSETKNVQASPSETKNVQASPSEAKNVQVSPSEEPALPAYHYDFLKKHSSEIKKDLLAWYYKYRRKLPWRNDQPPYTTSVQMDGEKSQGDIRKYFCKVENMEINKKLENNEDETIVMSKGKKKDKGNLPLPKIKRIKKENLKTDICEELKNSSIKESKSKLVSYYNCPINIKETEIKYMDNIFCNSNKKYLSLRGYQIYVSEIMLQQTKVHTVLNFYLNWMNKWSTIFELAKSNLDEVLILWKGLGYYNRAKNLLNCCKNVVEKYDGIFPNDLKLLKELPGIGDYTSKAICIHLYNRKDVCIDTNIIRIFSRITDTINYNSSTVLTKHCEEISNILCSDDSNYSDLSQALMDLGSSICNNSPQCKQCPLNKHCLIYLKKNNKIYNSYNLSHPDDCKLCVQDRNVEIKCVPLTKKKKKTDKVCLVLLVKKNNCVKRNHVKCDHVKCDNVKNGHVENDRVQSRHKKKITLTGQANREYKEGDYYLMIKNTNSNLFSMHYLFPFLLLDQFDKKVAHTHLNEILSNLNLSTSLRDSFTYINHFKHVFSHLTYDTYIYVCSVLNAENITTTQEIAWIKMKDIKDFTHNSFCQQIIDHYKKSVAENRTYFSGFNI
ncbi:A/G-specific adenine glycosylase [Plasmodium gonderi]|uniref:Adenine DNA glycosylase n=1 Tax=Plasmodium gonderi TaxID=77519 RepID=A0A1Y1JLX3_PLAGO|nr:A/G-specific adenine glycosylase [Plasmodium gonderi]GAW81064.1 A/G-specific adenine glycosylase [Plasmodium gonderi]